MREGGTITFTPSLSLSLSFAEPKKYNGIVADFTMETGRRVLTQTRIRLVTTFVPDTHTWVGFGIWVVDLGMALSHVHLHVVVALVVVVVVVVDRF